MTEGGRGKNGNIGTNICFDCQKACGGCSWSELDPNTGKPRFEPVPGWTAEKVKLQTTSTPKGRVIVETYYITACPEFVKDEPRKSGHLILTEEQSKLFLDNVTRILRRWSD